jgi:hypothetical protein
MNKGYRPVKFFEDEHHFDLLNKNLHPGLFTTMLDDIRPSKADNLVRSNNFKIITEGKEKMLPETFYRIKSYGLKIKKD